MTPRQLVQAALAHRRTPRVPYFIQLCPDAWERLAPLAGGRTEAEFLDNDVDAFSPPWWTWGELGDQWRAPDPPASRPAVRGTGSYKAFADAIKAAKDRADKYVLVTVYGSHFEKAYFARGIENLLADLAGARDFARRLHRTIIEKNLVMLENFLHLPEIDGVLLGSDWGSQRGLLMSPEVWDDVIRPGEQAEYDLVHACGKDVWVHSCGNIEPLVGRLVEMGLDVLNPIQPEAMDVAALKRDYGSRLAFWGGLSTQRTLPFGTPQQVRAEARAARDLLADGGGYVFAPAQSIQSDVPPANFLALLEVARDQA